VSAIGNSTFWKIILFVNGSVSQTRLAYEPKTLKKKIDGPQNNWNQLCKPLHRKFV